MNHGSHGIEIIVVLIISLVSISLSVFNFIVTKKFKKEIKSIDEKIEKESREFLLRSIGISEDKFSTASLSRESLVSLAKKLSKIVKTRYRIKNATTYSDLVREISKKSMDEKMKNALIEFFNDMIEIEYSKKSAKSDKELKKSAIFLIKRLGRAL